MLSLERLCLNEIVDDFEIHHKMYSTSDSVTVKKRFEFLQRVYSYKVVSKLHKTCSLKREYIDFVINKHLKELDTKWLITSTWDDISKKIAEVGPNFTKVIFDCNSIPWASILCHLPNLKIVSYHRFCNDTFLYYLAKFCPYLEVIDITGSLKVSNIGIKSLCWRNNGIKYLCVGKSGNVPCPMLKMISICSTSVGRDGVKCLLKTLPSLEKLEHLELPAALYFLRRKDINAFDTVNPYNLTDLNFTHVSEYPFFIDSLKFCISACPNLKSFSILVCTQQHLELCYRLPELETLHISSDSRSSLAINEFLKLKGQKLLTLYVSNFWISVPILIESCPRLQSLQLRRVLFLQNDGETEVVFPVLENISFELINLESPPVAQAVMNLLTSSPHLNHLCFKCCLTWSPEIQTEILKCCQQRMMIHMEVFGSKFDIDLLHDFLLTCSSLEYLSINGRKMYRQNVILKKFEDELFYLNQIYLLD